MISRSGKTIILINFNNNNTTTRMSATVPHTANLRTQPEPQKQLKAETNAPHPQPQPQLHYHAKLLGDLKLTTKSYSTLYPLVPLRWLTEKFGHIPPLKKDEVRTSDALHQHDRDTARLGATVSAFIGGATLAASGTNWGNATTLKMSFILNMVALTCFTNEWASTSPSRKQLEAYRWTPWLSASIAQFLLVFGTVKSIFPCEPTPSDSPPTLLALRVKGLVDKFKSKLSTRRARNIGAALISVGVFVPAAWRMFEVEIEERKRLARLIERKNKKYSSSEVVPTSKTEVSSELSSK